MTSGSRHSVRWQRALVPDGIPAPRTVPFDAPWSWLQAAWRDMGGAPLLSFSHGIAVAVAAGCLLASLASTDRLSIALPLAGGALLIGPFVAVGLYEISRRLSHGQPVTLGDVLASGIGARGQLTFFGAVLMLVYLVWMRLAFLLLMLFLGTGALPTAGEFMRTMLYTPEGLGLLVVGTCIGGTLAMVVFTISALAVPMLLVRRVDAISAARASVAGVLANPKPMALWALLIAAFMAVGFATLLLGLVVVFPLIGHATWHAYVEIYGGQTAA
jgi:uncharacterized membrane protein